MRTLNRQAGFSILEVLISGFIVSIISLAIGNMINNLNQQNKYLSDKLDTLEVKQQIQKIITDSAQCSCLINSPSFSSGMTEINLPVIKKGCTSQDLLKVNSALYPNSQVKIKSLKITNLSSFSPDKVIGSLEVSFDSKYPLKPLSIDNQIFLLDSSSPTKITGCYGGQLISQTCIDLGGIWSGSTCKMPMISSDLSLLCTGLGGTWASSKCALPASGGTGGSPSDGTSCMFPCPGGQKPGVIIGGKCWTPEMCDAGG